MKHALALLTLLATAGFVLSPVVSDPFTGFAPDQFPVPQIDPPVQPAGYAFAIWGVIYIWLILSAVFGLWARSQDAQWNSMRLPLCLSLGPGALWLWVAGIDALAATALIFWMMGTAIWALIKAPRHDRWLGQTPVALYAGWLTAAAHVSLGISLGGYGVAPPDIAAVLALALAAGVSLLTLYLRPDLTAYGLAVIWAVIGVLVANIDGSARVQIAALMALGFLGYASGVGLWAGQRARRL